MVQKVVELFEARPLHLEVEDEPDLAGLTRAATCDRTCDRPAKPPSDALSKKASPCSIIWGTSPT